MIRSLLRPAALPRSLPRALPIARNVTTKAPTTSSGRPSTDIAGTVAPGEEVDPQCMYRSNLSTGLDDHTLP